MTTNSPGSSKPKVKPPVPRKKQVANDYILKLYVAGLSQKSATAITNIKKICEENLQGRYQLDVIDLYQQPQLAAGEQIIAIPTLIRKLPLPLRRIIGDLSNTERVLVGLDIQKKSNAKQAHL